MFLLAPGSDSLARNKFRLLPPGNRGFSSTVFV